MKLLYVVQRYGADIVGGSEAACRMFAEHLVERGHEVEVLTSCAHSYVTWENHYPRGSEVINGVTVNRIPVSGQRIPTKFGPQDQFLMSGKGRPTWYQHRQWAKLMGPDMPDLVPWLVKNALRFDAVVFMTYLYSTTTVGIYAAAGRVPTVFQPTAHDEPPLRIPFFHSIFRQPDSYVFFTPEERQVVIEKFFLDPVGVVAGMGIELSPEVASVQEFRASHGLGDDPYVIYVGRLDPMKGVRELCRFFIEYKKRNPSTLKLVLAGEELVDLPLTDDIVVTGYLEESDKQAAIVGSSVLVQPSYFESFSIVLCEGWVQRRPALVQGASSVLRGQALRSNGALPYQGFAEFEASMNFLFTHPAIAEAMGEAGRSYVETNYAWETVATRFEQSLEMAIAGFSNRRVKLGPSSEGVVSRSE